MILDFHGNNHVLSWKHAKRIKCDFMCLACLFWFK